jgi:hypothetical protein
LAVFPVYRLLIAALALILNGASQVGASRFALVQVADPRGKALVDIGADDFVVQEDGVNRDILDLRVADYPVVVVLDNGSTAKADFPELRAAINRFITRLGPRPMAIVAAAGEPKLLGSIEDDRAAILAELEKIEASSSDAGQPLHAAALAAETISGTGALFSAIVVATTAPGETEESSTDAALAPIIDSRAVVHIVNLASSPSALLRSVADQTHGDHTTIYSTASFQPALDRLATRLTTELLVEYIVPVGPKPLDVKIGVRIPGVRVRGLGVAPR